MYIYIYISTYQFCMPLYENAKLQFIQYISNDINTNTNYSASVSSETFSQAIKANQSAFITSEAIRIFTLNDFW